MAGDEVLVIVLASIVGAFVKGVTGMGYPLFAVPIIALVAGVEAAVVVVAVPNLAANAYLCWDARDARGDTRDLGRLVTFGIVGAVIGTVALVSLPEEPLLLALALTIGVFVVQFFRTPDLTLSSDLSRRWAPAAGLAAGAMQGAVGVSGPVVATWLHGYRLAKEAFVFAVTLIFAATGAAQLVVLVAQSEFTGGRVVGSLFAAVPIVVMIPLGRRLRDRLGGPAFERAVLGVLIVSAFSLLVRVVS